MTLQAGHLLVVGGRAVSMPPPGALVEIAPRRASRAREGDSFCILVTPADDLHAPAALFEDLARRAADAYFSSGGSITGGLRESLHVINQHLITPGDGKKVNALVLVLHGSDLYAARCGQMFAVLSQPPDLITFPEDRHDPLTLSLSPLGTGPDLDMQMARYTIGPDHVMLLSDSGLMEADDSALQAALGQDGVRPVLDKLKDLAAPQASITVIRFAGPPAAADAAPVRRSSRPAPIAPASIAPASTPTTPAPAAPAVPPPEETAPTEETATPEAVESGEPPVSPLDRVKSILDRLPGRAEPEMATEMRPSIFMKASVAVERIGRDVTRAVLVTIQSVMRFLQRGLDTLLPAPDESGRQGIPTNVAISMAILIPAIIIVVVVGLALSERGQSDFEVYLEHARVAHQAAMTASGGDCEDASLRPTWEEVLRQADQAAKFRPDDLDVVRIRADALNYLDCFDKVQRRNLTLLREFSDGAELVGPVLHANGVELYTLDRTRSALYLDTLNERGDGLTARGDVPIFQRGTAVGPYTVGEVFDIEWLRSGGTVHDNVVIALDRSGVLFSYSQTFFTSAQQIGRAHV